MASYNVLGTEDPYRLGGAAGRAGAISYGTGGNLATLQTSTAPQFDPTQSNFVQPNQVQLPSWMGNANANMAELLKSYKKIPKAFDPTAQVDARNSAIAYQTTAGGQAANNAATEYANRAMQQGGSALGAGVVKAQAMMPVFAANAGLKSEAADVAAKAHRDAASLQSQIASTIANLRTSHLQTMAQFTAQQQSMQLQNNQFNSRLGLDAFQANTQADLGYKDLALRRDTLALQESDQARLAAMAMLEQKGPATSWTTNNLGQVTSGEDNYQKFLEWGKMREAAAGALTGMYR